MAEMRLVLHRAIYSRHGKRGERGRAVRDGSTACLLGQGVGGMDPPPARGSMG